MLDKRKLTNKLKKMDIEQDYVYWEDSEGELTFMKLSKLDNIRITKEDIMFGGRYIIYSWKDGKFKYEWGSNKYLPDIHLGVDDKTNSFDVVNKKDILKLVTLNSLEKEDGQN